MGFNYVWKPGSDGDLEKIFSGQVVCDVPKHKERIDFLKIMALTAVGEEVKASGADQATALLDFASKHIKDVKLTRLEDGYGFQSLDELQADADGFSVLVQIGSKLSQGIRLGKN